jgi:hypothetical protein
MKSKTTPSPRVPRLPSQLRPIDRTLAASARLATDAGVVASQNVSTNFSVTYGGVSGRATCPD